MATVQELHAAIEQIRFARWYTAELLRDIAVERWFEFPAGCTTHVAWQVGHLAGAQYWLALARIRGPRPEDEQFISTDFRQPFGRGSVPSPDLAMYPPAAQIRATFDRVHEHVLTELPSLDAAMLDESCERVHRIANTRIRSLWWCSQHELIHAGQIGLLRRHLGLPPQW